MKPLALTASVLLLLGVAPASRSQQDTPIAPGFLFVANQFEHSALLIDLSSRKTIATVGVDINGHEVVVSPDGRFGYVPIYGNSGVGKPGTDGSTIQIIDLQAGRTTDVINLPNLVRPHAAHFAPDGLLYVTAELANAVYAIDVHSHKVVAEIPTGQPESHMLALSPDGSRAYTANVSTGTISVLDLRKRTLLATIPVSASVQRLSLSPDGLHLYTHDQTKPRIAVIDTATSSISKWFDIPASVYASALTPDGRWLLAAAPSGKLFVLDCATGNLQQTYDMPPANNEIAVTPDGARAYITGVQSGLIEVLNLRNWKLEEPIRLTKGVDGIAWFPAVSK